MKKIVLAASFSFFIFHFSFAQNPTPNSGFEVWDTITVPTQYPVPVSWDNLNPATNFLNILTCIQTTDAHSGNFAAKLVTKPVTVGPTTDTANGIITTGHLIILPPYGVDGGIPFQSRPDSIYGWFKYSPTPSDSLQIEFDLFGANRDTIGTALFQTGQTILTYTRFSAPIVYYSAATPDTSLWLISSSNGFNSLPNSTLYIDDVGIIYNTGIDPVFLNDFISITPDPAGDFIFIQNENQMNGNLVLYDEEGKAIRKFPITDQSASFNISDLAEGIYFAQLLDSKNFFLATGKILIQR